MASTFKDHGREVLVLTFIANADMDGNTFVGGPDATTGKSAQCADGAQAIGVIRDDVKAGQTGDVVVLGTAWVKTSENLAAGDPVGCGATGTADKASTADLVLGYALGNTNSGEYAEIVLASGGIF
jgi:hypothetical protein